MKDDELRAFLESATVSGDEETQAESNAAEPEAGDRGLSFDELIDRGIAGGNAEGSDDEKPIVLPGPPQAPGGRGSAPRSTGGVSPTVPIVTPPAPSSPAAPAPSSAVPGADRGSAPTAPAAAQLPPIPASANDDAFPPTQPMVAPGLGSGDDDGDYEKIAVTGGEHRSRHLIPWLLVAGGVVVALLVAFFVVSSLSGDGRTANDANSNSEASNGGQNTSPNGDTGKGDSNTKPSTSPSEKPTTKPATPPSTKVPSVEVGPTMNMRVDSWGIEVDLSQKLGDTRYQITGEDLVLTSSLIASMPATCAGDWGMTKAADGTFQVLKPAERCAAAPELYDELWGLMDAMVKTARPL